MSELNELQVDGGTRRILIGAHHVISAVERGPGNVEITLFPYRKIYVRDSLQAIWRIADRKL